MLGRRLMRIGANAIPPGEFRELPTGVRMVLVDVLENPGSTIGQIVERTGFPQSHVSTAVARLRDSGRLVTSVDPADRRRTVVVPSARYLKRLEEGRRAMPPIDEAMRAALLDQLGPAGEARLCEATAAVELLASLVVAPKALAGAAGNPFLAKPAPPGERVLAKQGAR